MKAAMLGMTMPARYPPNDCIDAFTPVPVTLGVYGMLLMIDPPGVGLDIDYGRCMPRVRVGDAIGDAG